MHGVECSINFHLEFYKMSHSVRTDKQCGSRSDCTDCTVWCWIYTIRIYFCQKYNFEMAVFRFKKYIQLFFSAGYGLNWIIKAQDAIVIFLTFDKTKMFTLLHIRICFRPYWSFVWLIWWKQILKGLKTICMWKGENAGYFSCIVFEGASSPISWKLGIVW